MFSDYVLRCPRCGREYEPDPYRFTCESCGELLDAVLNVHERNFNIREAAERRWIGVWAFRELLPRVTDIVTLREGNTPLLPLTRIRGRAYVKFEGANPTGSFKDRGMTIGVSIAKSIGSRYVIVASTGNTAASVAAYAARGGLTCLVVVPRGGIARGKLAQAILHGATVIEVEGNFDKALSLVLETLNRIGKKGLIYPLNSINVWRLEGQKTTAFEIFLDVGVPDYVIVPVGNAGNIYAIWKGFKELHELGIVDRLPVMIGVQAEGASPIARAWSLGLDKPLFMDNPSTVASAIRIGRPVNWYRAWRAVKESNGTFITVSDEEILQAQKMLGREGIGVEPASAASLAGYLKLLEEKYIGRDDTCVLIATGHGLKDPDTILKLSYRSIIVRDAIEIVDLVMSGRLE
ncbi:MAG: threonine synthase [Crenarchaeota archaeon]|nr:threonine synthase [Thermoproteota archaeon]